LIQLTGGETATDQWILSRVAALVAECDDGFRSYDLNSVTQALYTFWWAELCDVYLVSVTLYAVIARIQIQFTILHEICDAPYSPVTTLILPGQ